ncbi:MAG: hypothetical protein HYT22_02820 [Candidatus Niyogibacteria bacterium]|nr:hypothetical protein [Candidatus Niyogibacteria bacterium]
MGKIFDLLALGPQGLLPPMSSDDDEEIDVIEEGSDGIPSEEDDEEPLSSVIALPEHPTLELAMLAWVACVKSELDYENYDEIPVVIGGNAPARYDWRFKMPSAAAATEAILELDIRNDPRFGFILDEIEDMSERRRTRRLPRRWIYFSKLMFIQQRRYHDDPLSFVSLVFELLDGVYDDEQDRREQWEEAKRQLDAGIEMEQIACSAVSIAVIRKNSNPNIARLLRAEKGFGLTIQQTDAGHVQIGAAREWAHAMPAIAERVRRAEYLAWHDGRTQVPHNASELRQEGVVQQIPNWELSGYLLLNKGTPKSATRLPLNQIKDFVEEACRSTSGPLTSSAMRYRR